MAQPQNTPDLGAMLNGLLANPAALSGILGMLGNIGTPTGVTATPPVDVTPEAVTTASVPETVSPPEADTVQVDDLPSEPASSEIGGASMETMLKTLSPLLAGIGKGSKSGGRFYADPMKHRRCLLLALRPYLSEERQSSVDTVIRLLDLLTLLPQKK